jgi:serine/threonine protein kinase
VFLAREEASTAAPTRQSSESVMALLAYSPQSNAAALGGIPMLNRAAILPPRECYVCAAPRVGELRFCEACGATMSVGVENAFRNGPPAERVAAVRAAAGEQLVVVGDIPCTDGDTIYFARERDPASVLLALVPRATAPSTTPNPSSVFDVMPAIDAIQPSLPQSHQATVPPSEPPATPADDPLVGALIDGKYRILRKLGQGGMGRVFDARHEQLRGRRAIKVMHDHLRSRTDLVTRFYEEARNAERVKHEHVCTVYDFGESDGLIYLAMEFVDGEPLSALIKRERKLMPDKVSVIVAQTAAALDAAHALKIVHRDVKPDNIMLSRRDDERIDVKVVDFGISKALNRSQLTSSGEPTQYGVVIGTLDYMSDEQRNGEEVDSRTDVYALGRTALKMLFGEFPDHSAWKEWSRTRVSPALALVLDRAFAPRTERYASAGEFSRDLTRVLHKRSLDLRGPWENLTQRWARGMVAIRKHPGLAVAAVGVVVALAAIPSIAARMLAAPIAISASPTTVLFEAQDGVMTPSSRDVRISSVSGKRVDGLGVEEIKYDSASTDWLPRPRWRDGNGTAPATLILEPQVGETPPGTYTAHVPVVSSSHAGVTTSITATLIVKAATDSHSLPIDSALVGPKGPDKCGRAQAQLARIRTLTDPQTGTPADARRVVSLVPALVPSLCTESDRVEARLRLAEAHMTLSQSEQACEVLRAIESAAASTPFATNVQVYLSHCR